MVNVNGNTMTVFDPIIAFNRTIGTDNDESAQHEALKTLLEKLDPPLQQYETGDEIPYRQQLYFNYPDCMAVILNTERGFHCQTFCNDRVGKLYLKFSENPEELRQFFEENKESLVVLENHRGRTLKPDFDALLAYVGQMMETRKAFNVQRHFIYDYTQELRTLTEYGKAFIDEKPGHFYYKAHTLAQKYLDTFREAAEVVRSYAETDIEQYYVPIDPQEQNFTLLGAYLYCLQHGINQGRFLQTPFSEERTAFAIMLRDMHRFISEHPGLVDGYYDYRDLPKNERYRLNAMLEEEGLFKKRWIFMSDDLF